MQFEYYFSNRIRLADALALAEHVEACPGCWHELVLYRVKVRGRLDA